MTVSTLLDERELPMNSELQKNELVKNDRKTKTRFRRYDMTS